MKFRTHGGKRKGAGRPAQGTHSRKHEARKRVVAREPMHVVARVEPSVGNLRTSEMYAAIREATDVVTVHDRFRIVHISIQRTHVHLIVEATVARI